ncbi:InlB B-repeat-containing protein [Paenibacillus soyae]|uniref:InlB B-repeat-containing protein n=1 Tax=Paenibacillus soyae TaxID=2969249 RepID=A0A9X2S6S8_9BACL|nr:InlB B-repeat-containing protein [Paenibacillus soyae]MCR2802295.1 InlB B-repeat-containing protein [Paenibacillus soyae]
MKLKFRTESRWLRLGLAFLIVFGSIAGGIAPEKADAAGEEPLPEPLLGEIRLFPFQFAPPGWVYCAGQKLSLSQNTAMYSLLGDRFGGDGKSTFALPDLRGLEPVNGMGYYIATQGIFPGREDPFSNYSMLGEIRILPYTFAPVGTRLADHSALTKSEFPELFNLMGSTFGGDNDTFNLPQIDPLIEGVNYYVSTTGTSIGASGTGEEYLAELTLFPFDASSKGIKRANGELVELQTNTALFSLLGTTYGGNGMQNYALPNLEAFGGAEIQYHIQDRGIFPSMEGNSTPIPVEDSYNVIINQPLAVSAPGVISNDERAITAKLVDPPAHGTVVFRADGSFTYTPHANYLGSDSFTYIASNNSRSSSDKAAVYLTVKEQVPVITGVMNEGVYKDAVTLSFPEGTGKLNEVSITSGTQVSEEGTYELVVTSPFGTRQNTVSFTIDKTAPVVTGVSEGAVYRTSPTISFNEGSATLGGVSFANGAAVNNDGMHTLVVTDQAGNRKVVNFAVYLPKTLSFDSNGGSAVASETVEYDAKGTEPAAPAKEGYTFGGWYTDINLTKRFDFETGVKIDTVLYAKWNINQYSVSFQSNGGPLVGSQTVEHNGTAAEPEAPVMEGYTFGGWYADSGLKTLYSFASLVTENRTVFAKWTIDEYTIGFDSNGGPAVDSQTVTYNSRAAEPVVPQWEGRTFGGWYTDSNLTRLYNFDTAVKRSMILYAKWTVNTYTVAFDSNGGSDVASQTVPHNGTAVEPTAPIREGYTFAGWYGDRDLTGQYSFAAGVTGNRTLYAKWLINQYVVTFNSNGGSAIDSQTVNYNAEAVRPAAPTREGYTLDGWYENSELSIPYLFDSAVTKDLTLYAKWTLNSYTVAFDSDGGSETSSQTVLHNGRALEPDEPVREGYTFGGWYGDSELSTLYTFDSSVTNDLTLYAKWTIHSYSVTFDSNGGSAVSSQTVNYNTAAAEPAAPVRGGYAFGGWYTDRGLTTPFSFTTAIKADLTLYAKWSVIWVGSPDPIIESSPDTGTQPILIGGLDAGADVSKGRSEDGRDIVNVTFDAAKLTEAFASDPNPVKTIAITGSEPIVQVELPAGALADLAARQPSAKVEIVVDGASYVFPVGLLKNYREGAVVTITIAKTDEKTASQIGRDVTKQGAKLISQSPIDFMLEVDGEVMSEFGGAYVERTIALEGEVDPNSVTGVWYGPDGSIHYVPSVLTSRNGSPVMAIHSPHNSIYAVIENRVSFADMEKHWAEADVELLASKWIVKGIGNDTFAPDESITRAQFAALLARALGLVEQGPVQPFNDVHSSAWYYGAVGAAQNAGLVTGYADGKFLPDQTITREQMAVMIMRAIQLGGKTAEADQSTLESFNDSGEISAWAKEAAAQAVGLGLISGTREQIFDAAAEATRAQSATMIKRLLRYLEFING